MIGFFRTIFTLTIMFLLSSCVTQTPAPIEHGSSRVSHRSSSAESDYDTPIEEKTKIREFWGDKEIKEIKEEKKFEQDNQAEQMPAPVIIENKEYIEIPQRTSEISHEVIEGETLQSIAAKYGISKESIIAKNGLEPPYQLEELQILKIPPQNETVVEISDIVKPQGAASAPSAHVAQSSNMPVEGKIISKFGEDYLGSVNQGVNIEAPFGTSIKAIAEGVVMHAGFDSKFGNLVIIKSIDSDIFTAYAHMSDLSLKNGENVALGQIIGHVGQSGNVKSPQLHFAVRRGKTPIDPVTYLDR